MLDNAFINAFITPADQDHLIRFREPQRLCLIEPAPRGTKHDDFDGLDGIDYWALLASPNRLDCFEDRFGLENHPYAAAEWPIIHRAMAIGREIPQIVDANLDKSVLTPPPHDSVIKGAIEELRKYSDNVKDHLFRSRSPSGKSTSIRRRSKSILFKYACANGISVSSSSRSTFKISAPPDPRTPVTIPM